MEKPRYEAAQNLAWNVLKDYSNGEIPIALYDIVNKVPDLNIMTYDDWAFKIIDNEKTRHLGITTPEQAIQCLGSEDSTLFTSDTKCSILYNSNHSIQQCRWNTAHEMGHYFFGHKKGECGFYEVQEKEANYFARQLLMPFPVVVKVAETNPKMRYAVALEDFFGVSHTAMCYTIENINKMGRIARDIELVEKFGSCITKKLSVVSA